MAISFADELEEILQPSLHSLRKTINTRRIQCETLAANARTTKRKAMRCVLRETSHRRKARRFHGVSQSTDVLRRNTHAHTGAKHIARQFHDALHRSRTTREHEPALSVGILSRE